MKKLCRFVLLFVSVISNPAIADSNMWKMKRVLVLHSYEPSYQWTADFQKGIDLGFRSAAVPTKLSIEYLDSKRVNNEKYEAKFKQYLEEKYKHYSFDGVIVTDDKAIQFLEHLAPLIKRDTPVVAAGINDSSKNLIRITDRGTVIYEKDDIESNIKLITKVQPKLQTLYYLADRSLTSELIYNEITNKLKLFPQINVIALRDERLSDVADLLSHASLNDAVLLTHYNTELALGNYYTYRQIAQTIGEKSAAPVFTLWEFFIQGGILGGYVNRSENLGVEAVIALGQYINLELEPSLSAGSNKRLVFDYDALQRLGMRQSRIPKDSVLLNEPPSFIKENLRLLIIGGAVILFLSTIILMQSITLKQKKQLAVKNKKILRLQKRTLSVQKEMIHVLGEAIESRSGETGNHVKRVAMLSARLAKLKGLSHRDVELIEIISPMHDVGKITVPESILDKPGRLTEEEWVIMKQHTTAGYDLLNTSSGDITNLAAVIAYEHHERWDGKGYPNGKSGEDIHLFARITAVADVFDALLSARCYKAPWSLDQVKALFEREAGYQFDPQLSRILLHNIDEFVAIREAYPDHNNIQKTA
ncbi:HD domain-containing phosphohydrolase [Vibrio profundi]|uniref:HD domain-containing phosphohydrolase n=1 Tax=Vibrio profundi TaxID=1774960 RepID=UPI003734F00E